MHTVTNNLSKCWNNHKIDCKAVIFVVALAIIFYGITYNVLPRDHSFRAALAQNWPVAVMIVAGMLFGRVEGSLAHRLNKNTHVQSSPSSLVEVRGESLLTPEREDLEINRMNDIRDMPKDPLKPLRVKPKTIDVPKEGERGVEEDLSIPLPQVEIPKKRNKGVVLDLITYVAFPLLAIGLGLGVKEIGTHWRLGVTLYGGMVIGRIQALFASKHTPNRAAKRTVDASEFSLTSKDRAGLKSSQQSETPQSPVNNANPFLKDNYGLLDALRIEGVVVKGKYEEGDDKGEISGSVIKGQIIFHKPVYEVTLVIPKEKREEVEEMMGSVIVKAKEQGLYEESASQLLLHIQKGAKILTLS